MVESRSDKTNACSCLIPLQKWSFFFSLKRHLNIFESPRTGGVKFSWDNLRDDGTRVLARLDKIYTPIRSDSNPPCQVVDCVIRGDNRWSNHKPVFAQIRFSAGLQKRSRWLMSTE